MDVILTEMARNHELIKQLGDSLRSFITQSGHPTGFFMANCIIEQRGRNAIVDVVRNPFKFFYLYNEAAERDRNAPVFSEKSIRFIQSLERKYAGR